jgi:hypothetical protein
LYAPKNEEENVINFIPMLAEQNYPNFEIVPLMTHQVIAP